MTNGTEQCGGVILLDPVQGLIDYVLDIKPYHTKVIDVLIDYIYEEPVNVTITEDPQWNMYFTRPAAPPAVGSPLQVPFSCTDDAIFLRTRRWNIESPNTTISFSDYPAMAGNVFRTLGDRRADVKVGAEIEMNTSIEDHRFLYDIVGYTDIGSPATPYTRSFVIDDPLGTFATIFDEFNTGSPTWEGNFNIETIGSVLDDNRVFTIKKIYPGSPTIVVEVYDAILSTSVSSPLPKLGLVRTPLSDQSGVRTVLSVDYDGGMIDSWPDWPNPATYVVGDEPHTNIRVSGANLTLPGSPPGALAVGQFYVSSFRLMPLNVTGVLSYSNVVRHVIDTPLSVSQEPDEGTNILPVLGALESTPVGSPIPTSWLPDGEFVVGRDFAGSNLFVGDILQVSQSFDNNGTFHIAEVRPGDPLPSQTTLRVVERVRSSVADGQILFDLPSNVFFLDGDHSSRFIQGKKFDVINGTHVGTYTTLMSDFFDGETRIRVHEEIIPTFVGSEITEIAGSPVGFIVFGNATAIFSAGVKFNVVGSTANDAEYEVASSTYDGVFAQTLVVPTTTENMHGTDRSGHLVISELGQIVDSSLPDSDPELCILPPGTDGIAHAVIKESLVFTWTDPVIDITELQRWEISGMDVPNNILYVDGNLTTAVPPVLLIDDDVLITEQINGGWYEVANITFNSGENRTEIEVRPNLVHEIPFSPAEYGYIERRDVNDTGWYQFVIKQFFAPLTIEVHGDARGTLIDGQPFRVIGGTPNDGVYLVEAPPTYNPTTEVTTVLVDTPVIAYPGSPNAGPTGFIEAFRFQGGIHIRLYDQIGVGVTETAAAEGAALVIDSGSLIDPWDYGYWDVGSFDERIGTLIHLYNNTP